MGAAALLLAGSVLLSRLLGFVREAVLAWQVGRSPAADAYYAAFQIPDLLNYFLAGGALSVAFIPFYTRTRERAGAEAARRLYATVLGTVGVIALAATALLWGWAEPLVAFQFPSFGAEQQALTVRLTRIVLPAQIAFATGGIVRAVLMAHGHFRSQAAAPLIYNLGIIAGGVGLAPALGVEGFAWGALVGAFLGPLGTALWEARGRLPLALRFAPGDADFRRYVWLALPLMLGVTLLTVDEWYDRWFGQWLGAGAIAALFFARRLMQAPVAVAGQAVATAALPAFSRLLAQERREEYEALLLRTLQTAVGLGTLAAGGVAALAPAIVHVVYVRGAFEAADAVPVAELLRLFCLAVPAWVAQQIGVRAFYARGDMWRPMGLGTAIALLAIPLYLALGRSHGTAGLATAGVLAIGVNAAATLGLARWLHGSPGLGALAATALRALACAGVAGVATAWLPLPADAIPALVVGGAAYALLCAAGLALLGDAPLREATLGLLRRLVRRAPASG